MNFDGFLRVLQVFLRDPFDINVIPIVEELQRRLPDNTIGQGRVAEEEEDQAGERQEVDTG